MAKSSRKQTRRNSTYGAREDSPPPAYSETPRSAQPHLDEHTPLLRRPTIVIFSSGQRRTDPNRLTWPADFCQALVSLVEVSILIFIGIGIWVLIKSIFWDSHPASLPPPCPTYSVAIIGAGPAGISAAQHLWRSAAAHHVCIDTTIFESAPVIGGQLALNASDGGPVFPYDDTSLDPLTAEDIAGNALIWGNPLFTKASEETLGDKIEFSELPSQQIGYFAGDNPITQMTRPYSKTPMSSWLGLIWKYGSSVWRAGDMAKDGDLRERIVDVPLVPDISQILISLGVIDSVRRHASDELEARGIGGSYLSDILGPQVQRAHAQKLSDISALALMMGSAQEDAANAYIGGDLLDRLEQIVSATGADVRTATRVKRMRHAQINEQETAWLVEQDIAGVSAPRTESFDRVIIAAPNYDLYGSSSASEQEEIEVASLLAYRPIHITFFTTTARLEPEQYTDVEQVLFVDASGGEWKPGEPGIHELAFVREVVRFQDGGYKMVEYLYRALSEDNVAAHLWPNSNITWVYQTRLENAYPYLYPNFSRFPRFKLSDKGLWWTSVIHSVASTIDLSWLAGKIAAEEMVQELTK
ncbi:hypothetical protein F5B20DRAFT_529057 [Whalleya microplaca]|nr:hypothetical protein F5B20DRAFT_529057 [Whalleya microplaca]